MRTSGRRASGVLVAAACVGTLAAATPAQAGLLSGLGSLLGGVTAPTTSAPTTATPKATTAAPAATANPLAPVLGLLGGQNGVGGVVQGLLCPPLSAVSAAVRNPVTSGLSPITDGLTTLVCNAGILDYTFQTRYRRADGTVVMRTQIAQLAVPTALNVDDDAAADLIGTITIVGQNAVGLKVERAPGESSPLPVQVEAIVGDPKGTVLGGRRIAVGYDARDDRAPSSFTISTPADTLLKPGPTVTADVTQTGRGERVAVLAGTFDGTPAARTDETAVRLDYRQAPDVASFTAGLAGDTSITATTNRPGGLLTATVTTPDLQADVALRALPAKLVLGLQGDGTRIAYDGGTTSIGRLTAEVRSTGRLLGDADHLRADLLGMPVKGAIGLRAPEDTGGSFGLTSDGDIDRIEVQAAEGDAAFPAVPGTDEDAGAYLDTTNDRLRLAARVFAPRSISVGTEPVSLTLKTGVVKPFLVDATVPGTGDGAAPVHVTAAIRDLPRSLTIGLEDGPDGTKLRYAADAPIDTIDVAGSGIPLVDGADRLHVRLTGVSGNGAVAVSGGDDDSALGLTAEGVEVGKIEVEATDAGSDFPAVPGTGDDAGAFLDTTGGHFRLAARVFQLRSITVDPDPVTLVASTGVSKPFRVDATLPAAGDAPEGAAPIHVTAAIEDLPTTFRLALEDDGSGGTRLAYDANERVGSLSLGASGVPLLDGADTISAAIRDVPRSFSLALPEQDGTAVRPLAQLSIGDGEAAIGELRLAAGNVALPVTGLKDDGSNDDAVEDLFQYESATPGSIGVGVRLTALKSLSLGLDPIAIELGQDPTRSKPVRLQASTPNDEGPASQITGRFSKTSATTSVRAILEDGQPTRLVFGNAANLARLELSATNLGSIPKLDLALDNVPPTLNVCVDSAGGCRRANPNLLSGGNGGGLNRPYAAQTSIDLDDQGTQAAGQFTTLNASLPVDGNAVSVSDLRFRNLQLDLGTGPTFSYLFTDVPRLYAFFDSRNQPFSIGEIKFPPTIESFKIGTAGQPATANNRIVWLKGTKGSIIKTLDNASAGTLACGGARTMSIKVIGLNINLLNFLGTQILPVCSS